MIDVPYLNITNNLLLENCSKNDARNLYNFMLNAKVYIMIINIKDSSFDDLKDNLSIKEYIEYMVTNSIAYFLPKETWLEHKLNSQDEYKFIGKYFCEQFMKQQFPGIFSINLKSYYNSKKWATEKIAIPFLEYNLAHGGDLKLSPSQLLEIEKADIYVYDIEEAVDKFKNILLSEYNCQVSNSSKILMGLSKEDVILSIDHIESSLSRLYGKTDSIDYLLLGIEKIRKVTKIDYWFGDGPFCNVNPEDCEKQFGKGYTAVDNSEIQNTDYENYGSSCQTGRKVLCRYTGKPTKYYKYDS